MLLLRDSVFGIPFFEVKSQKVTRTSHYALKNTLHSTFFNFLTNNELLLFDIKIR